MKNAAIAAGAGLVSLLALGLGHSLGGAERDAADHLAAREASEQIRRLQDQLAGRHGAASVASAATTSAPLDLGGTLAEAQAQLKAAQAKLQALEGEAREALTKAEAKADALVAQAKSDAAAAQQEVKAGQAKALAAKEQAVRDAKAESAKLRAEVVSLREEVRKLNDRIGKLEALEKVKLPKW